MSSSSTFSHSDGQMYCEELCLQTILEQCEHRYKTPLTPLFVYSKRQLHNNAKAYTQALKELRCKYQLNFSVKACQNIAILKECQALGTSATLVSGNELKLALEAGFEPKHLMFNGGGKSAWETHLAVKHGVLINVDSEWDLRQTIDICKHGFDEPRKARVLLRMNLNIFPNVHQYVNTGMRDCKFGLSEEAAEVCIQILEEPNCLVELVGLHSHLGSTIYQTDVFRLCAEQLLNMQQRLRDRGFTSVNILNVGGGLGIDYLALEPETRPWQSETENNKNDLTMLRKFLTLKIEDLEKLADEGAQIGHESDSRKVKSPIEEMISAITDYKEERISFLDMSNVLKSMIVLCPHLQSDIGRLYPCLALTRSVHASPKDLVKSIGDFFEDTDVTLMLEPGRSLVANSCVLLARVLGCKKTENKMYIISDAAMTEVVRPCLYGSYHHVTVLGAKPNSHKHVYDIVGPVCESGDFIAKDRILPDPENGLIVVHDVGAYCHSMSSNYNIRMKAAEVIVDGLTWKLIRRQDTFEDFMAPYQNLD